jgi:serine O-acetyltransferase
LSSLNVSPDCCAVASRAQGLARRGSQLPAARTIAAALRARLRAAVRAFSELGYIARDFRAMLARDPALGRGAVAVMEALTYAGFWALLSHRIAHFLRALGLPLLPRLAQAAARFATGVDIHPGARIGAGLFIDHGMGTVIGETAEIGTDVTLLHQVTLGARGGSRPDPPGRRHPVLGDRVTVGAGAKLLGPIRIGDDARIGANAVVLSDVPEGATAVGVPARIVPRAADLAAGIARFG